jgi:hypothetical protein
MPPFTKRGSQQEAGRSPGGLYAAGPHPPQVPPSSGGRPSVNRTLMILRVVYVLLIIAGIVGIAIGAMQGAWLIVVVAVFWISQESRYGFLSKR